VWDKTSSRRPICFLRKVGGKTSSLPKFCGIAWGTKPHHDDLFIFGRKVGDETSSLPNFYGRAWGTKPHHDDLFFLEGKWGTESHHYLIFVEGRGGRNLITMTYCFARKVGDGTSSLPNFYGRAWGTKPHHDDLFFLEGKCGTEPHHYLNLVEESGGRNLITTTYFF